MRAYLFSHVRLLATPWAVGHEAPLSMGFSRQEYWSGLPFPSPGNIPNPGIEPWSLVLQTGSLHVQNSKTLKICPAFPFHFSDCKQVPFWWCRQWDIVHILSVLFVGDLASLVAQTVKNQPAKQETWVRSLGREDPPEEGTATHYSILVWRILWTEKPGELQFSSCKELDMTEVTDTFTFAV